MDEKKQDGFSIPPKKSLFDDPEIDSVEAEAVPMPENDFIKTFTNDGGDKAVNLATTETDIDGNFVAQLGWEELDDYAQGLMNGDPDTRGLMVGHIFEGENAEQMATAEADDLTAQFAPTTDATDDEKARAIQDAKDEVSGALAGETPAEDFSEYEEEPMLGQLTAPEEV